MGRARRKEIVRGGRRGADATAKSLWLSSVRPIRARKWLLCLSVRVCVCVCVMRGWPVLLFSMWLSSSSGVASLPPPPPPVSLWSAIVQVSVPRRTPVSLESPFHALSLHRDTSSLSPHQRSCVHSSAVKLCLLVYFFFNCRLSLDTSVIWLTTANCFYLGIFFFFNWFALCSYICLLLHYAFIFFPLVSFIF